MSQARRAAHALHAAHAHVQTAEAAAGQHRWRTTRASLPQHISDLAELVTALETIHRLIHDLANLVKSCADDVRAHYIQAPDPTGTPWPDTLTQAAADADRALHTLRGYLTKTPVAAAHQALTLLHSDLRDTRRRTNPH